MVHTHPHLGGLCEGSDRVGSVLWRVSTPPCPLRFGQGWGLSRKLRNVEVGVGLEDPGVKEGDISSWCRSGGVSPPLRIRSPGTSTAPLTSTTRQPLPGPEKRVLRRSLSAGRNSTGRGRDRRRKTPDLSISLLFRDRGRRGSRRVPEDSSRLPEVDKIGLWDTRVTLGTPTSRPGSDLRRGTKTGPSRTTSVSPPRVSKMSHLGASHPRNSRGQGCWGRDRCSTRFPE